MRYSVEPAEALRKDLELDERQFSIRLDYDPQAYSIALKRGYLTKRMAKEISRRWRIPFAMFKVMDGH